RRFGVTCGGHVPCALAPRFTRPASAAVSCAALALLSAGCARRSPSAPPEPPAPMAAMQAVAEPAVSESILVASIGELPRVDSVIGPLQLRAQCPAAGAVIDAHAASFLSGTTVTGDASRTINGAPV